MKMRQISYFLAVCSEKSFTRAAQRCGVKQPSITVAIKQLEQEIGSPLFERSNSVTRLTDLGLLVRSDFARIERYATAAKRKAAKYLATHEAPNRPKVKETNMRAIAVTVATLAIFLMGLALRPAPNPLTPSGQAGIENEPYAVYGTIDIRPAAAHNGGDLI